MVRAWTEYSLVSISEPENENSDMWQAVQVRSPESSKIQSQTGVPSKSVYLKLYNSKLSETGWIG